MEEVGASPSYDLYADLFVEDAEKRKSAAAASATADEALRKKIEQLEALNAGLSAQNFELTTRLLDSEEKRRTAEKALTESEQKFHALRTTASDELKRQKRELNELNITLLKERKWAREQRMAGMGWDKKVSWENIHKKNTQTITQTHTREHIQTHI